YELYKQDHAAICRDIAGATYTDEQIADTMRQCLAQTNYQLDPHGACGYRALVEGLQEGETGIFLETAHPAKFKGVVDNICQGDVAIPAPLAAFMKGKKQSVGMTKEFADFKQFLLQE
ncbi:MAG: threonine synthase, partial [Bacteroidales bacterium]|nr:threonine synthase [Candidatus Physcousia equi]